MKKSATAPLSEAIKPPKTLKRYERSSSSIEKAEIPIMVADQLKWVTGLSKKTTVNEIIYVVLKKCNINAPELKSPTLSSSSSSSSSHKDVGYKEYVLAELNLSPIVSNTCQSSSREQNQESETMREISSELIIDGDSLVIMIKLLAYYPFKTCYFN